MNNCVRHNPEGCSITLTAAAEGEVCTLRVEDDGGGGLPDARRGGLAPDGGAAHGTGLRLVEQIARAHGGALELHRAARGVLAVLRLPVSAQSPGRQWHPGALHEKGEVWEENATVGAA